MKMPLQISRVIKPSVIVFDQSAKCTVLTSLIADHALSDPNARKPLTSHPMSIIEE